MQKRVVQTCRDNAKPVIVATQMLESMISHSRPTRAEASDVANAVIDGADAVMLSGETSVGTYPVQAVATMERIITSVEAAGTDVAGLQHNPRTAGGAIAKAAKDIGDALGAVALVAFTQTGDTARRLARLQPTQRLLVFTPVEHGPAADGAALGSAGALVWTVKTTDDMVRQVDSALLNRGVCRPGDLVVIVAGTPPGRQVLRTRSACTASVTSCAMTLTRPRPRSTDWCSCSTSSSSSDRRLPGPQPALALAAGLRRPGRRTGAGGRGADRRSRAAGAFAALLLHPARRSDDSDRLRGGPGA